MRLAPPTLGQHTDEVLSELGYDAGRHRSAAGAGGACVTARALARHAGRHGPHAAVLGRREAGPPRHPALPGLRLLQPPAAPALRPLPLDNLAFEDVSGSGTVWSYTVMHQKSVAGFEESVPYLTALVELDEQPMLLLRRTCPAPSPKPYDRRPRRR